MVQEVRKGLITNYFSQIEAGVDSQPPEKEGEDHQQAGVMQEDGQSEDSEVYRIREVLVKVKRIRYFGTLIDVEQDSNEQDVETVVQEVQQQAQADDEKDNQVLQESPDDPDQVVRVKDKLNLLFREIRDTEGFLDMRMMTKELTLIETETISKDIVTEILEEVDREAAAGEELCMEQMFNMERKWRNEKAKIQQAEF